MNSFRSLLLPVVLALGCVGRSGAVMFLATGDPQHNTTTPGDNSGWQYEGRFGYFLGVPIAPHFFITAKHVGGAVGNVLDFHGDSYTTIAFHDSPAADLRIWEVDHAKPFPTYAPLSSGAADIGATAAVFGRGMQRGVEVFVGSEAKGWKWGANDSVPRWGRNVVKGTWPGGAGYGELLYCDFDQPGVANECHLSIGDSGGGLFVLENGLWRLAGINYAVDGPFRLNSTETGYHAALYDAGGLEYENPPGWTSLPETAENVPASFYSTRISVSLPWISGIAPEVASLSQESYSAWQRLYFTPVQIAAVAVSAPLADADGDQIANLLEFALNLDPTFNEQVIMPPETGLRGLPCVRLENDAGTERLTIEFVRRTSGSGSGLTYTPEFSSNLQDWQSSGSETVTPINPRWERVKMVDSLTIDATAKRFARVRVSLAE